MPGARAEGRLGEHDQGTILFLDEVHRFNKAQQDALLPSVESGLLVLIGATTENPYFEVNPPLLSRSTLFRLEPARRTGDPQPAERQKGLQAEPARGDHRRARPSGWPRTATVATPSRRWRSPLPLARGLAQAGTAPVTLADAEAALGTKALRYGRDEHYDVISAFIKSIRGSDPHAGLYYLAKMLEAGEDARFIARRLVILASEDVGMADPMALLVANAAAHAVEFVGLPEAQLNLAQAVVHLATAPKSNRSALGIWNAREEVRSGPSTQVPAHLRDAHYQGAQKLGHGAGYDYPHDHPEGWVAQQYLPDERWVVCTTSPPPRLREGDPPHGCWRPGCWR